MRSRNHFRILQKRRYDARRFRNPYFQNIRKRNWKAIAVATLSATAFLGFFGFLFGSKTFAINAVRVEGAESISGSEIEQKVWDRLRKRRLLFFHETNRFLFDETGLRESLSAAYSFESLNISRVCEWNGGGCALAVAIQEKTSQLLWSSGDRVYLVDLRGVVIRELAPQEIDAWRAPPAAPEPRADGTVPTPAAPNPLQRLPVFTDVNAAQVAIGAAVMSEQEIANVSEFQRGLADMGIEPAGTKIDRVAGKWMAVETTAGYDIFVDALGSPSQQLQNLQVLLRDTVKDVAELQYIDLRFGDHVYYK